MNIIIVGAGDIGYHLCSKLQNDDYNITVIEKNYQRVQRINEQLDVFAIDGSGTSLKTLKSANIENTDILVAVTDNDEANLMSAIFAKKFGVETTIARVRNSEFAEHHLFDKNFYGIDLVIQPEKETANAIVHLIKQTSATEYIEFEKGKVKIIGIRLDKKYPYTDMKLNALSSVLRDFPLRILALKRNDITIIPRGDDILRIGDQIYVICDSNYTEHALYFFGKQDVKLNDIMILGGGLTGQYIAKQLENELNVKIIESDENKSFLLAKNLNKSLIINGDGKDLELLQSEDLSKMDEFIAVTGDDETNIISSLLALQLGVPRTITLLKKLDYLRMTGSIGLDAVITKQIVTVNVIRQFIRRKRYKHFFEIEGLDASIVEFVSKSNSKIVNKTLKDIKIPENVIFAAVLKPDNQFEIPTGNTQIKAGDRVVVFYLPGVLKEVEKLF